MNRCTSEALGPGRRKASSRRGAPGGMLVGPVGLLAAALVALPGGCASVGPQTGGQPSGIVPAVALEDLLPPQLPALELPQPAIELPPAPLRRVALATLAPDKRAASNDRDWIPEHKLLAYAEFDGSQARVHNVRNCEFFSYRDCLVEHYDKTYDLAKLRTVDFLMVPFNDNRALAHTMLSFGFEGGDYLGVSVEVRLEKGESYDAAIGLFGQFELIYVVADERDLIRVRTEHRDCDVLLYRAKATPEQARRLFVDVMRRVNQLREQPEFYDTLSNNCTTNIVRHINQLAPGRVPYDYRVLLPGFADSLACDLGLIDNSRPFAEVRRAARINDLALRYRDDPRFSQRIRGERVVR